VIQFITTIASINVMNGMKKLVSVILMIGMIGCGQKDRPPRPNLDVLKSTSLSQSTPQVSILPGLPIFDEQTEVPTTQIYITLADSPELIKLVSDYNCKQMNPEEIRRLKIPLDSKFLFKSWYAGSGTNYYGLVKGNLVELYAQDVDEGGPELKSEVDSFKLIRAIDLSSRPELDGFFICYQEDRREEQKISIYFDKNGMANGMKFKGDQNWISLQYNTSQLESDGTMPKTIDQYFAIVAGDKIGILNLTHIGNWDYAVYTSTKDGIELNFTIDHELTIVNDEYRKDACY